MNPASDRSEKNAVLEAVLKAFSGLRSKSLETMRSTFIPGSHVTLLRVDKIVQVTENQLIERVTSSEGLMEENITLGSGQEGDDGDKYDGRRTEVFVDGDVAVAWTPFEVRRNGVVINRGTNVFSSIRRVEGEQAGEWAICAITDSARPVG